MSAIQQALCSINNFLMEFQTKWAKELQGVDSTLKPVSIADGNVQKIAGRNPRRVEILIHNAGDKDLFLAPFDGEIGTGLYSLKIVSGDTLFLNSHNYAHLYKGDIYGFWGTGALASSKAMVTEFYLSD